MSNDDDVEYCQDCKGWHITDKAIKSLPWYVRLAFKLRLIKI